MHRSSAGFALLAVLVLAGCNSTPVATETVPIRVKFTGYTYGSGNAVDTPPPGTTTATAAPAMTVESDSTSRSGYTYGSGN